MEQLSWRVILALAGGLTGLFAVFVVVLFLSRGVAVGSAYEVTDHSQPPGANAAGAEPAELRPTVTVRGSDYGRILFDDRGYALYAFTRDPRGRSACVDACAESWPPYLVRGSVRAGAGAEPALLATTRRPNGDRQVTYAGRPLYHWVGDREPEPLAARTSLSSAACGSSCGSTDGSYGATGEVRTSWHLPHWTDRFPQARE